MVAFSFKNVEDGYLWAFAGGYGPNVDNMRRQLWDQLGGYLNFHSIPK